MTSPAPIDPATEIKSLKAELARVQKRQAITDFHARIPDMSEAERTAAIFTCINGKDYQGLKLVLRHGADANTQQAGLSGTGNTPLTYQYTDYTATAILLQHGANPNQRGSLGTLPLMAALGRKDTASFAALIAAGADANAPAGKDGSTVVHAAVASRNVDFLYHCRSANMNARDGRGRSALLVAIDNGDTAMAKAAIEYGADITQRDNNGASPKQRASTSGNAALVKLIKKAAKAQDYQATKDRIKVLEQEMAELKAAILKPAKACKSAKKCASKGHKKSGR